MKDEFVLDNTLKLLSLNTGNFFTGERGWNGEMGAVAENRAMKLRIEHNRRLSSVNKFAGLTRMDDYQPEMRANTSSHSARFPRFVQKEKTSIDPEWGMFPSARLLLFGFIYLYAYFLPFSYTYMFIHVEIYIVIQNTWIDTIIIII